MDFKFIEMGKAELRVCSQNKLNLKVKAPLYKYINFPLEMFTECEMEVYCTSDRNPNM